VIILIEYQESIEVLFSGAKVMGVPQMLEWKLAENMTRPNSDSTKVKMNYNLVRA
jgi:hypothetical protein